MNEVTYLKTTETAKIIRAELKVAFPSIKFSVRKAYWGVIDIEFVGSREMQSEVQELVNKYQCAKFDGMTDYLDVFNQIVDGKEINYGVHFIHVRANEKVAA